jgi:hypothetical protein
MKRVSILTMMVLSLAFAVFGTGIRGASAQLNPCVAPNEIGDSIEETAWQLWVAATCPVNDNQYPFVVWENWIEQSQLYPADPANGLRCQMRGPRPPAT